MNYLIVINRNTHKLMYKNGGVEVHTKCWWDKSNRIPTDRYHSCSKTTMRNKLNSKGEPREAIYLPESQTGQSGIFIHMGTGRSWSNGCIVIPEDKMLEIWNDISPLDGRNVAVRIIDDEIA